MTAPAPTYTTESNRHTALLAVKEAAEKLCEVLVAIDEDSNQEQVFAIAKLHGIEYTGQSYGPKWDELQAAINDANKEG